MARRPITARAFLLLAFVAAVAGALASAPVAGARSTRSLGPRSDPAALAGTWKRVVTQADIDRTASFREEPSGWEAPPTGRYLLVLANGSFTVRDKAGFAVAQTTRIDSGGAFDVLMYSAPDVGAFCPQWIPQNASYTWALDGSSFVLTAVDDRCADRSSILAGRWTRASNVRTLVASQTSSKKSKKVVSFTHKLTEGGSVVGSDSGVCKVRSDKASDCRYTLDLTDGTLVVRGTADASKPVVKLKIVSGTGVYRGAKGSASVKQQGATKLLVTLRLM